MTLLFTALAAAIALPVALPLLVFVIEVACGLSRGSKCPAQGRVPDTVVLIPAHNEAVGIRRTLDSLTHTRDAGVSILVVADNCQDDTAAVARSWGCAVVERHDPERRGKGYALAFGRDALAAEPPACVVVLDADCVIAGDGIETLARTCVGADTPVQSSYLFRPSPLAPASTAISNLAFLLKNLVRQQGMSRIAGVAVLTGTGFAVPWADFRDAPLASGDLVEDLALGLWLTRVGRPPQFISSVTTWSDAVSGADLLVQRRRWEHGFVVTARAHALPLFVEGLIGRSRAKLWLGLHLLVPPLALLILLGGAALLLTVLVALAGGSWIIPLLVAMLMLTAGMVTVLAWARYGREDVSARTLLALPGYIAAKLPIYRSLVRGEHSGWQRTRRPGEDPDG